jgi:hypothetical protein
MKLQENTTKTLNICGNSLQENGYFVAAKIPQEVLNSAKK